MPTVGSGGAVAGQALLAGDRQATLAPSVVIGAHADAIDLELGRDGVLMSDRHRVIVSSLPR